MAIGPHRTRPGGGGAGATLAVADRHGQARGAGERPDRRGGGRCARSGAGAVHRPRPGPAAAGPRWPRRTVRCPTGWRRTASRCSASGTGQSGRSRSWRCRRRGDPQLVGSLAAELARRGRLIDLGLLGRTDAGDDSEPAGNSAFRLRQVFGVSASPARSRSGWRSTTARCSSWTTSPIRAGPRPWPHGSCASGGAPSVLPFALAAAA